MNKTLITGGTGFIGKNLINFIINDVSHFKFVSRTNSSLDPNLDVFYVDSFESADWDSCFKSVSSIIHLAGLAHSKSFSDEYYQKVNVSDTLDLATAASKSGVKRFVFVSSIGVNGTSTKQNSFTFDSSPHPHNLYAESKYNAEIGLKKIAQETGLEVVIVRPTLVYGANAPGNFGILTKLVNKVPFLPFGLIDNKRDFIAVQNLADLLITCANHPNAAGHIFLATDGETVSIKDFTNAIAKGLNKKLVQLPIPLSLMYLAARLVGKQAMAEQLLGNLQVDSSNAQEVLGWVPPYTMEQAMASLSEKTK